MKLKLVLLLTIIASFNTAWAETNENKWNGKRFAVVLTYDDGLNVHLDNVVPELNKYDFKGTFYIPGKSTLQTRLDEWRTTAEQGHELGNHTLFHPCDGSLEGREWVKGYDLSNYSLKQIEDELTVANTLLQAIDRKTQRTYAYTCGDYKAGENSFKDFINENFIGARGVGWAYNSFENADLLNINCLGINGQSGEELISYVKEAQAKEELLVFLFHGVGGEHSINVSLDAHNQLIEYLHSIDDEVWVAPMVEVLEYIKSNRLSK